MHRRLDEAIGMVEDAIKSTTLSELLPSDSDKPLCDESMVVRLKEIHRDNV